jgi:hypothetical protein
LEFCEGAFPGVADVGAALVSVLELSEPGAVIVEEAGDVFVSFLLDCCGTGVPVEAPVPGAGALLVSILAAGTGVVTTLVSVEVVSVVEDGLLRLHPVKTKEVASTTAAMIR